jgi:fluoride exporter
VTTTLWVAAGGAVGSVARYGLNLGLSKLHDHHFPWGIFMVNVLGSLAMGILVALFARKWPESENFRLALTTGLLGGFTTFSAFSYDVVALIEKGEAGTASIYALTSVLLSVLACFAGLWIVRVLIA